MNIRRRSLRDAFDHEIKRALNDPNDCEVIEWEFADQTYIGNRERLIIVRTGALGGDVRDIHGGWIYHDSLTFDLDWAEIRSVPSGVIVKGRKI